MLNLKLTNVIYIEYSTCVLKDNKEGVCISFVPQDLTCSFKDLNLLLEKNKIKYLHKVKLDNKNYMFFEKKYNPFLDNFYIILKIICAEEDLPQQKEEILRQFSA